MRSTNRNTEEPLLEHWSAPGSLLIAGEYRISEPGGLGLAVAAGARAELKVYSSESLIMEGHWQDGALSRYPGEITDRSPPAMVHMEYGIDRKARLNVDTVKFFGRDGEKKGYGSSAAATVLFARGLCEDYSSAELEQIAISAHRRLQGGRGSGYDVVCSIYGGACFFAGGTTPIRKALVWPHTAWGWILKGPAAVRTDSALTRYEVWREKNSKAWMDFSQKNDSLLGGLVESLNDCRRTDDLMPFTDKLKELAALGIELGERISIDARPKLPDSFASDLKRNIRAGVVTKCLGAGDEVIFLLAAPDTLTREELNMLESLIQSGRAERLQLENDGLRRESL